MSWSNTEGGDHEGDNWVIANGTTISGIHYGLATVTIASGDTVYITQGTALEIHAETINCQGTIYGQGRGYLGGKLDGDNGLGPGGGHGDGSDGADGGGAGYGGAGGASSDAAGGVAYGDNNLPHIYMGSGGGCGDSRDGGNGGAGVTLVADTLNCDSATINCRGADGLAGANSGGGGGSGGGILLIGNNIDIDNATLNCDGGEGGHDPLGGGAGGNGAGGRIKVFSFTSLSESGTTKTVLGNDGGGGGDGGDGTTFSGALAQVDSVYSIGQTFKIDTGFPTAISKIDLYTKVVSTGGNHTLKIWDSPDKTVEYASKTVNITSTGVTSFVFDSTVQLPASDTEYYIELTPDGASAIRMGINGYDDILDGSLYYDGYEIVGLEMYMVLYGYSHVTSPTLINLANTNIQCELANSMLSGAIHKINRDGSGSIEYTNDFTSDKYLSDAYETSGVTYDGTNDKLDFADDAYVMWKVDTKYPIAGIPALTARIEVLSGTPTLQVSYDGATWFDIDDAIVNDTDTEYLLKSGSDIAFKGRTIMWFRLDCTGVSTNTCSLKSMDLNIDMVTVHAQIPEIVKGASNTFRLDQDSGSALNCTLELDWRDRKLM